MKALFAIALCILLGYVVYVEIDQSLQTKRQDVTVDVYQQPINDLRISVAVIADPHLDDQPSSLNEFRELLIEVKKAQPDVIAFLGDYVSHPRYIDDVDAHRTNVAELISTLKLIPIALVLGNYESYTDHKQWIRAFQSKGLTVLNNRIDFIEVSGNAICIRGLGDWYTQQWEYVDFPGFCDAHPKLTLTHDPAGAFDERVEGLVLSGHTHCGQIRLPFIGAPIVPTEAPKEATCGLYQDSQRTVFTSSGIGTSILPIRFGTQSQWEMLTVRFSTNSLPDNHQNRGS